MSKHTQRLAEALDSIKKFYEALNQFYYNLKSNCPGKHTRASINGTDFNMKTDHIKPFLDTGSLLKVRTLLLGVEQATRQNQRSETPEQEHRTNEKLIQASALLESVKKEVVKLEEQLLQPAA